MTFSGHVAVEGLEDLRRTSTAESARPLIVDLRDVIQVDRDAVVVLASFKASGIELRQCPIHVMASIDNLRKGSAE